MAQNTQQKYVTREQIGQASPRVQPGGSRGGVIPVVVVRHNQSKLSHLLREVVSN